MGFDNICFCNMNLEVDKVTPHSERIARLVATKAMWRILPQELCDLVGDELIELLRSDKQRFNISLLPLRHRQDPRRSDHGSLEVCNAVILLYDMSSRNTFNFIRWAYKDLLKSFPPVKQLKRIPWPLAVIAIKRSQGSEQQVTRTEGLNFATDVAKPYFEVSEGDYQELYKAFESVTKATHLFNRLPVDLWEVPKE